MLLVLDTCEHLAPCPKVQSLATSREPLRVPGESELPVPPPRLRDALALFTRRAAEAGLQVTPENRAAAASICVQLDKLPLAIDLAAGELARDEPLTERSVLLADERTPGGRQFLPPVTLRGYGRQMLRRLGEDAEFADRFRRWQDTRRRGRGNRTAN